MPSAGVVIIGDEILTGKFADQNGPFLISELRALGVELRRLEVIPDDLAEISATVGAASSRFDHVFTSGGVGPTHDDVTISAIAAAFGLGVVRHPELERRVRAYFGERISDANLRLAEVPGGAELLWGKDTTWPVVAVRNVVILPGVPELFRRKFVDIRDRFRAVPLVEARLYVDAEEGALAEALGGVASTHPAVKIGSYPRFFERDFRVMLTLEGAELAEVTAAFDALTAAFGALVVRRDPPARIVPA